MVQRLIQKKIIMIFDNQSEMHSWIELIVD